MSGQSNNIIARSYDIHHFQVGNILYYILWAGGLYTELHKLYVEFYNH